MTNVPVNPEVLKWARLERGLGVDEAADRLGMSEEELLDLENEDNPSQPTLGVLRNIAKKYEIAFATLLMPEPLPADTRPEIEDFRTVAGQEAELSLRLNVAIEDVHQKIDTLADLRNVVPDMFWEFASPRISLDDNAEEIADEERRRLGISVDEQLEWPRPRAAFESWRNIVESQGTFVVQHKLGLRDDVRGFSVLDERELPIAVLNSQEADYGPRNFTLFHEYAHLMLRRTGISDENRHRSIERFCNQFAAFFLMPRQRFVDAAHEENPGAEWSDVNLGRLANAFKTSLSAVAIHLEETELIGPGFYDARVLAWGGRDRQGQPGGRATHPEKWVNRLGIRQARLILDALDREAINRLEAYELLDVRPTFFAVLRQEVNKRLKEYGGAGQH